ARNAGGLEPQKIHRRRRRQRLLAWPTCSRSKRPAADTDLYLGGFTLRHGCRAVERRIRREKNPWPNRLHAARFVLAGEVALASSHESPVVSKSASVGFSRRLDLRGNLRRGGHEPFVGERNRTLRSA